MPDVLNAFWEGAAVLWEWIFDHIFLINLLFSAGIVFFQRKDPKTVWAWLLALNFIPVFGIIFYLLFCQDFKKSRMFRVKEVEDRLKMPAGKQENAVKSRNREFLGELAEDYESLVLYNLNTSGSVLTVNNRVQIFTDGEKKFSDLRKELQSAKKYIHMEYYIIKNDEVFASIAPILEKKAADGVKVRILADGMGGRFMPSYQWERLRRAGVKVGIFFPPVLGRLNLRVNYRNHRKIVVVDGRCGYAGGFNIGREYVSKEPKFGFWRDTHLKLFGEAVMGLQIRFALDWNYAVGENLFKHAKYFELPAPDESEDTACAPETEPGNSSEKVGIQIIASGPDTMSRQIRDNYLELFHKARHHIYIQTPYFVPDDAVLSALQTAARSGVDVRLMIPCKPDHPFVYWATYSYVGDLLKAGARCYAYEKGFLHAKGVCTDGKVCCYGTANMDIRSFELNFEVNAVIYNSFVTRKMEEIFMNDLKDCREITMEDYQLRSLTVRFKEQCSRLLSPLL